ncbi:MAG TPA: zinc finger domain-containing protein, partial [Burkholderiaceae bacterium]|nr:zinc finger domain-containing protein [Burkholderiaceae bacterium]
KEEYTASDETIFTQTYYELPAQEHAQALTEKWERLRAVRSLVQKQLEDVRVSGAIGSSLQAEVDLYADGGLYDELSSLGDDVKFVMIVSRCDVHNMDNPDVEARSASFSKDSADIQGDVANLYGTSTKAKLHVKASTHEKCERCWHYRADVGAHAAHPGICGRCVSNQFGDGEMRSFA